MIVRRSWNVGGEAGSEFPRPDGWGLLLDPEQFGEFYIDLCLEAVIKFSKFSDHQVFQDRCDLVQSDHRINFETALQETCVGGGHHNPCRARSGIDLWRDESKDNVAFTLIETKRRAQLCCRKVVERKR
jgi:hypothetical protein